MSENFTTPEGYTNFVTRLASKYSMADFNAKLGTLRHARPLGAVSRPLDRL
jgi:hypothetical protein